MIPLKVTLTFKVEVSEDCYGHGLTPEQIAEQYNRDLEEHPEIAEFLIEKEWEQKVEVDATQIT